MSSNEVAVINFGKKVVPECKENEQHREIKDIAWECFNDIDCKIYFAERLMQGFKEQYFGTSEEAFQDDKRAQNNFVYNHEYMAAQIQAISDMLFDIRLKCEFVSGNKNNPIIAAHIYWDDRMREWLKEERKGES